MSAAPKGRRIVKKKGGGHGHHGGAWKVAYADFVTAMMALFMVLWLVASSDAQQQAQKALKEAIAQLAASNPQMAKLAKQVTVKITEGGILIEAADQDIGRASCRE